MLIINGNWFAIGIVHVMVNYRGAQAFSVMAGVKSMWNFGGFLLDGLEKIKDWLKNLLDLVLHFVTIALLILFVIFIIYHTVYKRIYVRTYYARAFHRMLIRIHTFLFGHVYC